MKRVKKPMFFIVAILIFLFTFSSAFGLYKLDGDTSKTYIKGVGDIRWGIDINGGVEATFSPDTEGTTATKEQMDSAKSVIETRLIKNNITDYELYADYNHERIIVRFPWKNGEVTFDPEQAINELSATAQLTFREGNQYSSQTTDDNGNIVKTGPTGTTASSILLEGKDVKSASAAVQNNQSTGKEEYVVSLEFTDEGAQKFADATKKIANEGSTLSIWMDDTMISYASVDKTKYGETGITGGKAVIQGSFTAKEVSTLANQINSGALPFKLNTTSFSTVSPVMGTTSLQAMLIAGIIGFVGICLFMLFVFRLPGLVAIISLCGQIALCFAAVSGYFPFVNSFTLTLPGIAGIILSIGMGVDANIITATRIKEEICAGKSIDNAIRAGDENSFWAIFDGNITTIIVSVILMLVFGPTNILSSFFGPSTTGSIYSFGYTLLIGNIGNFIFGVFTTRTMTKSLSSFKCFRKRWLFGGLSEKKMAANPEATGIYKFHIGFSENKKIYIAFSLSLFAIGIICNVIFGTQLDIQFKGGSVIKYSYQGDLQSNDMEQVAKDITGKDATVRLLGDMAGGSQQKSVSISFAGTDNITVDEQTQIAQTLSEKYPDSQFTVVESSSINPTMGSDFFKKCIVACIITVLLLVFYVSLRFKNIGGLPAGTMAIVALLHDVLMIYFTFIIFRIPLNDNFIAVALTILGYSLNDTIIIYDRIRENRRLLGGRASYAELVDLSTNQTLTRSIYTALCTFFAITCVFVLGSIFNLPSVTTFALPMMVGVLSGCYSSVCIAGPLYVAWEEHKKKNKKIAAKATSTKPQTKK